MASASRPSRVSRMKSASRVCIGLGYTFPMGKVMWVMLFAIGCALAYWCWFAMRRYGEKKQAEEARSAGFMAQAVSASFGKGAEDAAAVAQQRLLFESAAKAGEAGEPALSIQ